MVTRAQVSHLLGGFLGLLTVSGCSGDPASEAAITVPPGLYLVSIGASSGIPLPFTAKPDGSKSGDDQICLSSGDDAEKLYQLFEKRFSFDDSCVHEAKPRVGNLVSGQMICPGRDAFGVTTSYKGSIAADGITLNAAMLYTAPEGQDVDATDIAPIEISLTAKRQGDCS